MMKKAVVLGVVALAVTSSAQPTKRFNEVWTEEQEKAAGIRKESGRNNPLPYQMFESSQLPSNFTWCDNNGVNYCTMSRNQHLPQYCGSCWAHGAISALGDRIKIARKAKGIDINLAVQHMLNCGDVGSCHGGSVVGPYQWIHDISKSTGSGISYETSVPYIACSQESQEGFCPHADTSCNNMGTAGTCSTFSDMGGHCTGINHYPNATVVDFGSISGEHAMENEIYHRGPISCGIDATLLLRYTGGILDKQGGGVDHVISVVGWGEENGKPYWIVRNSWGEYWGEMGYVRVAKGRNAASLEDQCAWGVIGSFTETNYPCYEGGENCGGKSTPAETL